MAMMKACKRWFRTGVDRLFQGLHDGDHVLRVVVVNPYLARRYKTVLSNRADGAPASGPATCCGWKGGVMAPGASAGLDVRPRRSVNASTENNITKSFRMRHGFRLWSGRAFPGAEEFNMLLKSVHIAATI